MIVFALIISSIGLYLMLKWLWRTPIVFSPERMFVALSADLTLMLIIGVVLCMFGVRLVMQ